MASDGLHLFMDAIHAHERGKNQSIANGEDFATLLEIVKLSKPDRTADETTRYTELLNSLEAKNDTNERDKNFTFTVPEHTLESWMNHLITETRVRPLKNIHYKEFNSCLYANENSYEKNVEDEGIKYRDEQMALAANVNATVQQQEIWIQTGMRQARVNNLAALGFMKQWILLKRELPNDTRIEDSLLRFTDDDRKKPEWHMVILNLKKHGESESHGYDMNHFKQALDRWISFFLPSLQKITDIMESNEVASLLMSMHKPKPKFDILQKGLMELVRHQGEDLESKLALLKSLATSMYQDFTESERIANVDRILLNGILQFTHGSTRKNAELAIEFEKRQGKHICYESILQGALNSERVYGVPTVPLP